MKNNIKNKLPPIAIIIGFILSWQSQLIFASNKEVNIGLLQAYTGPIESLVPRMEKSAKLAFDEISKSGIFLNNKTINIIRADSTCVDSQAAVAAAERLLNRSKVAAIVGPNCSGATSAVISKVSVPNGVVNISSSATSPALSTINDRGYFFRTAPSDARQGQVLAKIAIDKGIKYIAITYTNNDYGKGMADSFKTSFKKLGGKIAMVSPHEDGKADYSADIASLAASGASVLAVFGYVDQGGKGIVRASVDTDAFDSYIFSDGMIGNSLLLYMENELEGSFGTMSGSGGDADKKWKSIAKRANIDISGPYTGSSYDAAAIITLSIQRAGSVIHDRIRNNIIAISNAPGEKIYAGELKKALRLLAEGKEIDYVGATNVEFSAIGEVMGSYDEMEIIDGKFTLVNSH